MYEPYLAHYGVKGMRWGVRKKRDDIVIRRGKKFQRISLSREDSGNGHKYAYSTYKRKDNKKYSTQFAKTLKSGHVINNEYGRKSDSVYKITYRAKNDLVSPSLKSRIDVSNKLLSNKDTGSMIRKEMVQTLKKHYGPYYQNRSDEDILKEISTYDDNTRQRLFGLTVSRSKSVRDAYFKEVSSMGYNAVVDDADSFGYAKRAMIVLDRYKDLEYKKVEDISKRLK